MTELPEQPQHKIKHLKYAKENIEKPQGFWKDVLWTNESKIEYFGHHKRRYVCRKKCEALPTMTHGGGFIMPWGCVATGGTGNILVRVEGRMDSTKYLPRNKPRSTSRKDR